MTRWQQDRGAAAVEFALVLPLLLLLIFGVIDFGRAYHAQVTLTHGAREGVRLLAFGGTLTTVSTSLNDDSSPLVVGAVDDVTVQPETSSDCATGTDATLTLAMPFRFLTPLPGMPALFGGDPFSSTMQLRGRAVMRCGG